MTSSKSNKIKCLILFCFCGLSLISDRLPISYAASSGSSFLKIDPSPKSYALGNSNAVYSFGAESLNSNPAHLAFSDNRYELFSAFS